MKVCSNLKAYKKTKHAIHIDITDFLVQFAVHMIHMRFCCKTLGTSKGEFPTISCVCQTVWLSIVCRWQALSNRMGERGGEKKRGRERRREGERVSTEMSGRESSMRFEREGDNKHFHQIKYFAFPRTAQAIHCYVICTHVLVV